MSTTSLEYDVVVVGGGAAGIAASVGAARAGARTCLVEQYGFLGGAATNSSVLTHCGFFDQTGTQVVRGVGQQVLDRLAARQIYRTQTIPETGNTVVLLDMETMKVVYDELVSDSGVDVLLHSVVTGARRSGEAIRDVDVVHRGGTVRLAGAAFVDCSGDGALIAAAGAGALVSDVEQRQAATMVMRVGGVPEDTDLSHDAVRAALERYNATAAEPLGRTSGIVVRLPVSREVLLLLVDQHCDVLDINALTAAEMNGRTLAWTYLSALRENLPGFACAFLSATGPQIGIRETRRLRGREVIDAAAVSTGRKRPDDAIARCGWPMENHVAPGVTEYGGIAERGWYHAPFDAIRSDTIANLTAGGRLTSSDARAYASLRVMGTSFATGHAAGVAGAVYAKSGRYDYPAVRAELESQGALI